MACFIKEFEHLEIQLEDIKSATNNFDKSKVIGRGGFGNVYAGELSLSQLEEKLSMVAIKRLDRKYGQGDPEFFKEIRMLSCYRHENLISLLGFCRQGGEMILVYEYASHGSLDRYLSSADLTWLQRLRICIDAAKGLSFLHDPNGTQQRVLHCDIKSANILLNKNMTAKVSDFGLSKMGPAHQKYSLLITNAVGTPGYCDPLYMQTYSLTKESDVYSFGVVLLEVLCGSLCAEISNGNLLVHVSIWKKFFKEKRLDEIIFPDLIPQMGRGSLETYADIAFQCVKKSRKKRPTMSLVLEKLEKSLEFQMFHDLQLPKEYQEIAEAAASPLRCRSLEELKALLSKGFYVNNDKMWLSSNSKGERIVMVSIQDYLTLDDLNKDYSDPSSVEEKSRCRFKVGFYKTCLMEFKLHVRTPLFLSPGVTYGLNIIFHYSEIENMKQQHVGIRYKLQGAKTISIVHLAENKEHKRLVAELYQFISNNEKSIIELEIFLEDCGLSGDFYIEGIEFRPVGKVESQVVIANQEIVRSMLPPLFYRFTEEWEVLLSQGILLNGGTMWLSINNKREFRVVISIEDCLSRDKPNENDSDKFSLEKDSRFAVGCYKAYSMNFKIRVRPPFILSPHVIYGINLIFHCINIEHMKLPSVPMRYKLQGETKMSIVHLADQREDGWLVAELYRFTSDSDNSILDLEIIFEKCGFWGDLYIEGIEFQPLGRVEHAMLAVGYDDIHKAAVTRLFYTSTEELKMLLTRGILLNGCKTWFSINDKEEHSVMLSIEDCLVSNAPNSDEYSFEKYSRFPVGCYFTKTMNFEIRVRTPLFLSPCVRYRVNLVFNHSKTEQMMKQQSFPIWYKLQGETKMSIVHLTDKSEYGSLVAELYQFTSDGDNSFLDLQIIFEKCGFSGDLYIQGIEFQPLGRVEHAVVAVEYEEILKAAVTPVFYTSVQELKLLLSRGIILNGCKTWLSINEKEKHIERIYIEDCLNLAMMKANCLKHPSRDIVNSRFPCGFLYEYYYEFEARVRGQYLTPQIPYMLNIVFRFKYEPGVYSYYPLRYKLDGEAKVLIIYPTNMREDGWFVAPLYQFTSQHTTIDLEFEFEYRRITLLVAGFEFQPLEEKVDLQVTQEYQDIVKAASHLFYRSLDQLKRILSIGVHLNGYKTWFSLDEKGQHCHMISMEDCLIQNEQFPSQYKSDRGSRFPAGFYQTNNKGFKTHVKTRFLSPSITYTVNLVFYVPSFSYQDYVNLKYRLRGETTTSTVYLANQRKDEYLYIAELYQFTSDGSIVDLEIDFDDHGTIIQGVEGILFQPLEIVEDQVSMDEKVHVENFQTISDSDSDTDWEQKFPNDYEEILNLSKDSLMWTTKKELYSILRRGFLIDNGQKFFGVDKHGKKSLMLSARESLVIDDKNSNWESLPESRFGEVLMITSGDIFEIKRKIKSKVVSPETTYAVYLVYKLPQDQSTFEAPLKISYRFAYLVCPRTPVIGPNLGDNTHSTMNRPNKLNNIPQQRSDGWMGVKVWEFHTKTTGETISMDLKLEHPGHKKLIGLMVQGIEIRPM